MNGRNYKILSFLNIFSFIAMVSINILANILFLGIIIKRLKANGDFYTYIILNVIICMTIIFIAIVSETKKYKDMPK